MTSLDLPARQPIAGTAYDAATRTAKAVIILDTNVVVGVDRAHAFCPRLSDGRRSDAGHEPVYDQHHGGGDSARRHAATAEESDVQLQAAMHRGLELFDRVLWQ